MNTIQSCTPSNYKQLQCWGCCSAEIASKFSKHRIDECEKIDHRQHATHVLAQWGCCSTCDDNCARHSLCKENTFTSFIVESTNIMRVSYLWTYYYCTESEDETWSCSRVCPSSYKWRRSHTYLRSQSTHLRSEYTHLHSQCNISKGKNAYSLYFASLV